MQRPPRNRPPKNRPSNVVLYVVASLMGLVGLFILGQFLESLNWNTLFNSRQQSSTLNSTTMGMVHDG